MQHIEVSPFSTSVGDGVVKLDKVQLNNLAMQRQSRHSTDQGHPEEEDEALLEMAELETGYALELPQIFFMRVAHEPLEIETEHLKPANDYEN